MSGEPGNSEGQPVQGGEAGIGGMDQRAMFMDELSKMTPEQQKGFLSQIAQLPEEQRANFLNALGMGESAGESLAERLQQTPGVQEVADDQLKQDAIKASRKLVPGMEDAQREEYASKLLDNYAILTDPTKSSDHEAAIGEFAKQLENFGFRKGVEEDADAKLIGVIYPKLKQDQLEKVIEKLPEISDQERESRERADAEDLPEEEAKEADQRAAQADAMGQVINATGEQVKTNIAQEIQKVQESNMPQEEKDEIIEELKAHQGKVDNLTEKVKDLFAEGQPGRKWARRAGKTLYWSLMIAFILLVAELNMINKMSQRRR